MIIWVFFNCRVCFTAEDAGSAEKNAEVCFTAEGVYHAFSVTGSAEKNAEM